jgi:hypothetical protein
LIVNMRIKDARFGKKITEEQYKAYIAKGKTPNDTVRLDIKE